MAKPVGVAAVVAVTALSLAACGGGSSGAGGDGGNTLTIATDLPLQGAQKDASESTNNAIKLYLDKIKYKVGNYNLKLVTDDDSTAAAGKWDSAQCTKLANQHVQDKTLVGVMGTFNSGCAKIEIPILNQAPDGPLLMVSHANTYVGLTKPWDKGEPAAYYPSGKRNYARVVTTDDVQGAAGADFLFKTAGVKKCYVLNDNETYGSGVAKSFADSAAKVGIQVLGNEAWDPKATNYTALFQKIQGSAPDCIFLGGIADNNGAQLIKDKVAILGDNAKVKLLGPDGFTGVDAIKTLPAAQGMYLTFAGLSNDQLTAKGGPGAQLLTDYKAKYGKAPDTSYALYGVAALQVILKAIELSDGTRKGVADAVFSKGITIPGTESVLGKDITISKETGDINAKDVTVETIKNNAETFVQAQTVS